MNFKERKNLLEGKQQVHLLRFLDQLNDDEKQILFSQIDAVDWGFEQAFHNDKKKEDTMIEEIDALHLDKIQADSERYRSIGLQAIKEGKLCLLLLAGGQGTRLGFDKPKGCFNVGITKELYIFQLLIEHTLDIVRAADAWIPLYIMTSNINYQDTVTFFEAHDYFGYNPAYVHFFVQELNPATDFNGKILLKSKYELALSPNGNGGWFSSMHKAGLLEGIFESNLEWINVFSVDNVLQRIAVTGYDRDNPQTYVKFGRDVDQIDFRLVKEFPGIDKAYQALCQVTPYEIADYITEQELTASREWIKSYFFETEHTIEDPIFLPYQEMYQFIPEAVSQICDRLPEYITSSV